MFCAGTATLPDIPWSGETPRGDMADVLCRLMAFSLFDRWSIPNNKCRISSIQRRISSRKIKENKALCGDVHFVRRTINAEVRRRDCVKWTAVDEEKLSARNPQRVLRKVSRLLVKLIRACGGCLGIGRR